MSSSKFPKQLGAMERVAVDLGNLAVAAIELGEALTATVAVGGTAGANSNFATEYTEAVESLREKVRAFSETLTAVGNPQGRTMRDLQTIADPQDTDSPLQ
jgi:hypothetical protein